MAIHQLRPLSVGEILDGSFSIYRRIFGTLISIAIVCQGVPNLLYIYVQLTADALIHLIVLLVAWLLTVVGGLIAAGATLWAISESYLGREPSFTAALRYALSKIWKLLVAGLAKYTLIFLATVVGIILLFIPGMIVACGYSVVAQVVVLEPLRAPTDALGRSWSLTRGFKLRAFFLYVIVWVLLFIPSSGIGALAMIDPENPAIFLGVMVLSQTVGLLIYPIFSCVFTLFYYDLRVRKEAFDLQHLSRQLEGAPAA